METNLNPLFWLRPELTLRDRHWPTWRVTVLLGSIIGIFAVVILAAVSGASPWVAGSVAFFSVLCAFGLAMTRKVFHGYENYTFYHYHLAILIAAAVFLSVLRYPLLTYLDLVAMGLALALAVGRIGCLMVGCCHGRPFRWGVCYRKEHADLGFTPYYVGIRLFPVQAVESIWVFLVVATGAILIWKGAVPGMALAWYIVAYALGRFTLEFMRGDPERPYRWDFTEAQWTSLLWVLIISGVELAGVLPFSAWHVAAAAVLILTMIAVAASRRYRQTPTHALLSPRHVQEVAAALTPSQTGIPTDIRVARTSLGILVSAGCANSFHHYALSAGEGTLTREAAEILAGLILQLERSADPGNLVKGDHDIFYLLVPAPAGANVFPRM